MTTATYEQLSKEEKFEIRMFGCLEEQVQEAVTSYLKHGDKPVEILVRMLGSAWRELNWGDTEDASQTLNRVKITIERFYSGDERDMFMHDEGKAYSILSDAQHLMEYDDIIRAKVCIDEAIKYVESGKNWKKC